MSLHRQCRLRGSLPCDLARRLRLLLPPSPQVLHRLAHLLHLARLQILLPLRVLLRRVREPTAQLGHLQGDLLSLAFFGVERYDGLLRLLPQIGQDLLPLPYGLLLLVVILLVLAAEFALAVLELLSCTKEKRD